MPRRQPDVFLVNARRTDLIATRDEVFDLGLSFARSVSILYWNLNLICRLADLGLLKPFLSFCIDGLRLKHSAAVRGCVNRISDHNPKRSSCVIGMRHGPRAVTEDIQPYVKGIKVSFIQSVSGLPGQRVKTEPQRDVFSNQPPVSRWWNDAIVNFAFRCDLTGANWKQRAKLFREIPPEYGIGHSVPLQTSATERYDEGVSSPNRTAPAQAGLFV